MFHKDTETLTEKDGHMSCTAQDLITDNFLLLSLADTNKPYIPTIDQQVLTVFGKHDNLS